MKKRCRDGVICAVFVCPVSTPSSCGFWHCHPYIPVHFWKMFYLLVCVIFCCTIVHHVGGCCSSALPSGTKKKTRDHRQLMLCVMGWEYIYKVEDHHLGKGLSPFKKFLATHCMYVTAKHHQHIDICQASSTSLMSFLLPARDM